MLHQVDAPTWILVCSLDFRVSGEGCSPCSSSPWGSSDSRRGQLWLGGFPRKAVYFLTAVFQTAPAWVHGRALRMARGLQGGKWEGSASPPVLATLGMRVIFVAFLLL